MPMLHIGDERFEHGVDRIYGSPLQICTRCPSAVSIMSGNPQQVHWTTLRREHGIALAGRKPRPMCIAMRLDPRAAACLTPFPS